MVVSQDLKKRLGLDGNFWRLAFHQYEGLALTVKSHDVKPFRQSCHFQATFDGDALIG